MGKIRLAVVGETLYAKRLVTCIQKNAPEYLDVLSCAVLEKLPEFLIRMQPDVLLCEEGTAVEERLAKYIVKIQLVNDKRSGVGVVSDDQDYKNGSEKIQTDVNERENTRNQKYIFRYQRGSDILRQIFQIYEQSSKKNLVCRCKTEDMEMTAFYAPGGHELLLPFSISYASLCGKNAKVLYLNLSEFSGMKALFRDKDGNNLSDLIFGIRQKKERFLLCLQSVLHHAEQFDYVLPPENPEDLYEIQEEDLACLLTMLQEQTEYTKIVWNCGTMNQAVIQVMECCQKVFCVSKENLFGKYRKTEFEQFLQKELRKTLRDKVQYVIMQMGTSGFVQGVDLLTQLQSGEFADQVQKMTEENHP